MQNEWGSKQYELCSKQHELCSKQHELFTGPLHSEKKNVNEFLNKL